MRGSHRRVGLLVLCLALLSGLARAEAAGEDLEPAGRAAPGAAPPLGLDSERRLREDDFLRKVEGV